MEYEVCYHESDKDIPADFRKVRVVRRILNPRETQQQAGQPSTITLENSYTFNLVSNASSTETGGGIQVLAGPLDTKQG